LGIGERAAFAESREALVSSIAHEAKPGDVVLVMGARDPSLTGLARRIVDAIAADVAVRAPRS
jgi:UDP-N-acetylmuramate--alanine ligase